MLRVKDFLKFRRDLYFEGAVQADWFYEKEKIKKVAEAFVFHGPEYFGVTQEDIGFQGHTLIDTCSFTEKLTERIHSDGDFNPLILAIAGYGSGKSHYALTLGSLFSNHDPKLTNKIIKNITTIDRDIGKKIESFVDKPNFVIILNGMKDFNLNYEIINSIKKTLEIHNLDTDIFKDASKAYDSATHFVGKNFEVFNDSFLKHAKKYDISLEGEGLKKYLCDNIEKEPLIFEIINEVYYEITGNYIKWDVGFSASEILAKVVEIYCGERGYFNKVVILFDEFGRFIEYAGTYPTRAGDSALQQIFEVVQNAARNIIFVGFIQSDLKTYFMRVEKSSNIVRYVGRYESSERYYLSSNLETIFANLIERKDDVFDKFIRQRIQDNQILDKYKRLHKDLLLWLPQVEGQSIWQNWKLFQKVVLEGTYPLHPFTTYILANLSNWLQQRSALTFLEKEFEEIKDFEIKNLGDLFQVFPTKIATTDFFKELLLAEEEGRQQSEYCILYNDILKKYGDKLSRELIEVLASILVLRIGRFKTSSREEVVQAITYCCNLTKPEINNFINELEIDYGVISFDDTANCFDFIGDAVGANDFKRFLQRKKANFKVDLEVCFTNEVRAILNVNQPISTHFANENSINTNEWNFTQEIYLPKNINRNKINYLLTEWKNSTSPSKHKGSLIWIYRSPDDEEAVLEKLCEDYNKYKLYTAPILMIVLDDSKGDFLEILKDYLLLDNLNEEERGKYHRFYHSHLNKSKELLKDIFDMLAKKRLLLTENGIQPNQKRLKHLCFDRFNNLYPKIPPFPFDGFQNINIGNAKKNLVLIARNLLAGLINYQWVQGQSKQIRNRIEMVLFIGYKGSWGIIGENYNLIKPLNSKICDIFNHIDEIIENNNNVKISKLMETYTLPPYGMNEYALSLLVACYLTFNSIELRLKLNDKNFKPSEWANIIYTDRGVKFDLLEQSVIFKINVEEQANKVLSLCKKIEKNTDIDSCVELSAALSKLLTEEDIPENLIDKVKACQLILEDGLRCYSDVQSKLTKYYQALEEMKLSKSHKHGIRVIKDIMNMTSFVGNSTKYRYGKYEKEFETIEKKARDYIESTYPEWIKTVNCDSVGQISGFDKWMKNLIYDLKDLGYPEYSLKTSQRLETVLENIDKIRAIQSIRESLVKYLKTVAPSEYTSYNNLLEWKKEGETLSKYIFEHLKLTKHEKMQYQEKLSDRLKAIEKYIKKVENQINEIYDKSLELKSINECQDLLNKIHLLIDKSIPPKELQYIKAIGNELQNFTNDIGMLNRERDKRQQFIRYLEALDQKYADSEDLNVKVCLDEILKAGIERLDKLEEEWVDKYIKIEKFIDNWNTNECLKWKEQTKLLPDYLSDKAIQNYHSVVSLVEKRLNALPVEAAIALFNKLTNEQKEKFFQVIGVNSLV